METLEDRGITSRGAATWSMRLATVELFPLQGSLVKGHISEDCGTVPDQLWCIQVTWGLSWDWQQEPSLRFLGLHARLQPRLPRECYPSPPTSDLSLPGVIGLGKGSAID